MRLNTFKLEEYLGQYEFSAPYLLCCSDAESFSQREILQMAQKEHNNLWDNLRLGYTEATGLPELRSQIKTSIYKELKEENILTFAGAEEGIFIALNTLLTSKDHVVVLTPCYQSLKEIPKSIGCEITEIELKVHNHWRIDISEIQAAIKSNTKCLIINFPHNPTGQVLRPNELSELIAVLEKKGIWLFSDEVYRLLGNPRDGWASAAACKYDKAISLGVMSKAFGMAGLRVGWIACQNLRLLKQMLLNKYYTSICNSAPSEVLSLIALSNAEKILLRNNEIVKNNLSILDEFFAKYKSKFSWIRPEGGCVGYVKYFGNDSVEVMCEKLVKKEGVLLMPAELYDHRENYFRIGFGRKNMNEALLRFENFVLSNS